MSHSPGDTIRPRPWLEQIADCGNVIDSTPAYRIADSNFIRNLNKLTPRYIGQRRTPVWERTRPTSLSFVRFIFQRLSVKANLDDFTEFLQEQSTDLAEQVKGLSLQEQSQLIGTTIRPESAFRRAFNELDVAVSDFHGNLYDGELQHARLLGCFVIEYAREETAKGIAS